MVVWRASKMQHIGPNWGGKRAGAGRPRRSSDTVPHARRPTHSDRHPVHVTLRVRKDVPSLRGSRLFRHLRASFNKARDRFGFRLAHYSVQGNHVHLIVEAHDSCCLSRGMQGLSIRIAKAVNRVHARRGAVFTQRYHARPLRTALHVRRALVYVLFNDRHHLAKQGLSLAPWSLDACSSALEFRGFIFHDAMPPPKPLPYETTVPPHCYLLGVGWHHLGLVRLDEAPGDARHLITTVWPAVAAAA